MFRAGSQMQFLYEIFQEHPNQWFTSLEVAVLLNALREGGRVEHWKYYSYNTAPMLVYLFRRGAVERMNVGTDINRRYAYKLKECS